MTPEQARQGNPAITAWCSTCECRVVPSDDARCLWCRQKLRPDPLKAKDALVARNARYDSRRLPPEEILRLRDAGLRYPAIVIVARLFYGTGLSESTARKLASAAGAPRDQRKARYARWQHEQRRRELERRGAVAA